MSPPRRNVLWLVAALIVCLAVPGCGVAPSFRYRLTLAVQTPEGIRSASSVVEVAWLNWGPDYEYRDPGLKGEALYLDLGKGRRPLIALLARRSTCPRKQEDGLSGRHQWGHHEPTQLLAGLQGIRVDRDMLEVVRELSHPNEPYALTTSELPELVTFADPSDPKSILPVDPNNLEATLGPGVSWVSRTLEFTNAPITAGIQARLQWLNAKTPALKLPENGTERYCFPYLFRGDFKHPI